MKQKIGEFQENLTQRTKNIKQERHTYYTDVKTYEEAQMNSEIVDW